MGFLQFHVRFPAIPPLMFPSESNRLDPSTIIPYIHSEHTWTQFFVFCFLSLAAWIHQNAHTIILNIPNILEPKSLPFLLPPFSTHPSIQVSDRSWGKSFLLFKKPLLYRQEPSFWDKSARFSHPGFIGRPKNVTCLFFLNGCQVQFSKIINYYMYSEDLWTIHIGRFYLYFPSSTLISNFVYFIIMYFENWSLDLPP